VASRAQHVCRHVLQCINNFTTNFHEIPSSDSKDMSSQSGALETPSYQPVATSSQSFQAYEEFFKVS